LCDRRLIGNGLRLQYDVQLGSYTGPSTDYDGWDQAAGEPRLSTRRDRSAAGQGFSVGARLARVLKRRMSARRLFVTQDMPLHVTNYAGFGPFLRGASEFLARIFRNVEHAEIETEDGIDYKPRKVEQTDARAGPFASSCGRRSCAVSQASVFHAQIDIASGVPVGPRRPPQASGPWCS